MATQDTKKQFSGQIDKASPLPYHYQLRELIRAEIVANRWQHGDQIPGENQLCDTFQVSRTTVREALDALVAEGLLTREKGLGTFVAVPKFMEAWSGSTIGFSDSLTKQGYLIETRVLELRTIPAPHQVRPELNLRTDDKVFLLKRLRYILKEPVRVVDSYLPEKLFPKLSEIDFTNKSLYETLRQVYGVQIVRAKRSIEAIAADDSLAHLLEVDPGFPIMFIENTAYVQDGTPVEFYVARRRGDRSRFQFEYSLPSTLP
jgi:GntR family transcriptional regulator